MSFHNTWFNKNDIINIHLYCNKKQITNVIIIIIETYYPYYIAGKNIYDADVPSIIRV